jgi:TfoX/Sxy family transcriptional regulator of competence genes
MAMEELSERVRTLTPGLHLSEKKMFGGRCFMLAGNMLVCPMKPGSLLVRVGPHGYQPALERPGAQPMTMGARTMGGFVEVSGDVLEDDDVLLEWIELARSFVATLPPK